MRRIHRGSALNIGPVSLGEAPKAVREATGTVAAVSDPQDADTLPKDITAEQLTARYRELLDQEYHLVHAAEVVQERTVPRSGRYKVRVSVESYYGKRLDDIVRVSYRVWDDFRRPVVSTTSLDTNFDLWLSIYGEFPVLAYVERKDKAGVFLSRYLDLPGRPPD